MTSHFKNYLSKVSIGFAIKAFLVVVVLVPVLPISGNGQDSKPVSEQKTNPRRLGTSIAIEPAPYESVSIIVADAYGAECRTDIPNANSLYASERVPISENDLRAFDAIGYRTVLDDQ